MKPVEKHIRSRASMKAMDIHYHIFDNDDEAQYEYKNQVENIVLWQAWGPVLEKVKFAKKKR